MGTTPRHRRTRNGMGPRLGDEAWRRHSLAAVGGLVVVSLLGYSSQPVRVVDVLHDGSPPAGSAVRAAMMASAPDVHLRPAIASVTEPGEPAAMTSGRDDIPGPALAAYQRAASVMAEAAPACELSWTLLAGVGRVESDHGRYGGAVLGADGVSRPHIVGVALDGTGQVAEMRDTDDGELDGDEVWDRAVGPMQFLPTTWALAGVDGDGDDIRSPHDMDDAALAAGVYLCAGGRDLSQEQDVRAALLRYNPSTSYAALVMTYERRYRTGRFAVDSGPAMTSQAPVAERISAGAPETDAGSVGPSPASGTVRAARDAGDRVDRAAPVPAARPAPAAKSAEAALAAEPAGTVPPTPAAAATQPVAEVPAQLPTRQPDSGPAPRPDADPAPQPEGVPATDGEAPGDVEQATRPAVVPEPDPAPVPDTPPTPDPEETDPTAGPADGVETERVTVTGVLTACDAWFCLEEQALLPGVPAALDQPADADLDGDGEIEIYLAEVTGLVGRNVVVVVDKQEGGWLVYAIHELVEALVP